MTVPDNPRGRLLMRANAAVNRERNASYGEPNQDFMRISRFWQVYLEGITEARGGLKIMPHDVALMIDLQKTSRLTWNPASSDNWVDKAGYSACGWHCAVDFVTNGDDELPPVEQEQAPVGKPVDHESVVWGMLRDPGVIDPDIQRIFEALGIPNPDSLHDILDRIGKLRAAEEFLTGKAHPGENIGQVLG